MKILSYNGKEPSVIQAAERSEIIGILKAHCRILEQMATTVVMIPEGTRIRDETPPPPRPCCYCGDPLKPGADLTGNYTVRSQHRYCHREWKR